MIYDNRLELVRKAFVVFSAAKSLSKKRSSRRMLTRAVEASRINKLGYVGDYKCKNIACLNCWMRVAGYMECPFHLDD